MSDRTVTAAGVYNDLGRFTDAYTRGCHLLDEAEGSSSLRSYGHRVESVLVVPTDDDGTPRSADAEEYGVVRRSTNPPESTAPSGGDPELRWRLIHATQMIADAIRHLAPLFEDFKVWEPKRLAHVVAVEFFDRPVMHLVDCDEHGNVRWKDPSDALTPVLRPEDVCKGVDMLRGLLRGLGDDVDPDDVADAVGIAARACSTLRGAGTWSRPNQPPVCKVRQCWKACEESGSGYRDVCAAHRKAKQRGAAA
jgi:hypothetical protein